jgi:hypothetical protein
MGDEAVDVKESAESHGSGVQYNSVQRAGKRKMEIPVSISIGQKGSKFA